MKAVKVELADIDMSIAGEVARLLNNPKLWVNLSDAIPHPYTEADAIDFLSDSLTGRSHYVSWAVLADGQFAGLMGYEKKALNERYTGEIGYWLGEEFWGRGIGTVALKLLVKRLFDETDLIRLEARTFDYNRASQRILKKSGFKKEAVLRKAYVKDGKMYDDVLFSLIRK